MVSLLSPITIKLSPLSNLMVKEVVCASAAGLLLSMFLGDLIYSKITFIIFINIFDIKFNILFLF